MAGGIHAAVLRRLQKGHNNVIVSYRRSDGSMYATHVGYGRTLDARIADADAQLPPGNWERTCVSTPASIFLDLQGRADAVTDPKWRGTVFVRHERKVVVVP